MATGKFYLILMKLHILTFYTKRHLRKKGRLDWKMLGPQPHPTDDVLDVVADELVMLLLIQVLVMCC